MDDDAIIVVLAVTGTGTGAVIGKAIPALSPNMVIVVAVVFGAVGTIAGYFIVAIRKKKKKGRLTARNPSPKAKPAPTSQAFRKRLADFTGHGESEVMVESDTYKSKMPFWTAIDVLVRIPPKSARLIRRYLLSIRKAVRGQRH